MKSSVEEEDEEEEDEEFPPILSAGEAALFEPSDIETSDIANVCCGSIKIISFL